MSEVISLKLILSFIESLLIFLDGRPLHIHTIINVMIIIAIIIVINLIIITIISHYYNSYYSTITQNTHNNFI